MQNKEVQTQRRRGNTISCCVKEGTVEKRQSIKTLRVSTGPRTNRGYSKRGVMRDEAIHFSSPIDMRLK